MQNTQHTMHNTNAGLMHNHQPMTHPPMLTRQPLQGIIAKQGLVKIQQINLINHYPVDSMIFFLNTSPVESDSSSRQSYTM